MNIKITEHSNLYFSAQLLVNNILSKILRDNRQNNEIQYQLSELKHMLDDNAGSSSVHLEAIAHLMQSYVVSGEGQTQPLPIINDFEINGRHHTMTVKINPEAKDRVQAGQYQVHPTY
jgi:hypothetical protein